jgi:hypothetical protein
MVSLEDNILENIEETTNKITITITTISVILKVSVVI